MSALPFVLKHTLTHTETCTHTHTKTQKHTEYLSTSGTEIYLQNGK